MPMNTMLVRSVLRGTEIIWLIMAPASRLPLKPPCPVMQNLQPMRQPAWLETHRVARSRSGMKTASTSRPAYAFKEVFGGSVGAYGLSFGGFAPHGVFRRQFAASLLGRSVIASMESTRF